MQEKPLYRPCSENSRNAQWTRGGVSADQTSSAARVCRQKQQENTITAVETLLAVKTMKTTGGDEIQPEMLEALNRGVLWPTRVCQVTWCSGMAPKVDKLG